MKLVLAVLLFAVASIASAQQYCICNAGCTIASDPVPGGQPDSPTSCTIYKGGVAIGTAPVVLASTLPISNNTTCMPPSALFVPGAATNVACSVPIPAQPLGSVTLTGSFTNNAGEGAQGAPYTFSSVATLPVLPGIPKNLRVR